MAFYPCYYTLFCVVENRRCTFRPEIVGEILARQIAERKTPRKTIHANFQFTFFIHAKLSTSPSKLFTSALHRRQELVLKKVLTSSAELLVVQ